MKAYIKDISYYLPEKIVTNDDLVREFPEWSVEKIAGKIGVKKRHIASYDETATDLAIKAAEKLFNNQVVHREDIDFILFCTQSPDYPLPTSACIIQNLLKLSTNIGALDFNLGCSGYVYGLSLAKGLIMSNVAKNVLLITAETYSKYIHPDDKSNRTIFGDAATATVISADGFAEIKDFSLGTDGKGAENLIVRNGGCRNPQKANNQQFDINNFVTYPDYLYMNGSEIFSFTLEAVPTLVNDVLLKNRFEQETIDLFIFHQANKYILNFLRKKIKIEESKFYYCMELYGNTVSSTIPIALTEAMKGNRIQINSRVLIAGFGVGYSWGGTILQF